MNNEGMTKMKQYTKKRQYRAAKKHLNSNIKYPDFTRTDVGSEEYLNAIDDINDMYRKMLEIGKAAEVFHDKECPRVVSIPCNTRMLGTGPRIFYRVFYYIAT